MAGSTRRPLMAGNWKMNLNHFEANLLVQKLAARLNEKQLTDVEVVVLPPFTDLRTVQTAVEGDKLMIGYGAQDLSPHDSGAYTGDISGSMLAKLGCTYVVVGHSERRVHHHESDALCNAKVKAALSHGLTPILCVGEGLDVREQGRHVAHCAAQLEGGLSGISAEQATKVVVAYEPVWAIGTGKTATPEDAQEVCGAVRDQLAFIYDRETADQVRILYGGSVKASNVAATMAQGDVDGALVGGASLDAEEFAQICRFPEHIAR
ncbi:triose-phosphate isomerase [Micromonospora sp. NPDC005367]|uniref:triose-phosphate isomerase n=1 Tax=Micromonospora sp. NPDC005367 TaxID=3155590 RepID=UPI0033AF9718